MTAPLIDDLEQLAQTTPIDRLPKLIGTLSESLALAQFRMRHEETAKGAPTALLTVKEVAEQVHLSEYRVYELIRKGHIKKTIVGTRSVRVKREDLAEYLAKSRKGPLL